MTRKGLGTEKQNGGNGGYLAKKKLKSHPRKPFFKLPITAWQFLTLMQKKNHQRLDHMFLTQQPWVQFSTYPLLLLISIDGIAFMKANKILD